LLQWQAGRCKIEGRNLVIGIGGWLIGIKLYERWVWTAVLEEKTSFLAMYMDMWNNLPLKVSSLYLSLCLPC
jgi:hypothetical protein